MGNLGIEFLLTAEELGNALDYWRKRLRLLDWDVAVSFLRLDKMAIRGADAEICWNLDKGYASIALLHPDDKGLIEARSHVYDAEVTLVHELLHLKFARFEPKAGDAYRNREMEVTIHHLSEALVDLDRAAYGLRHWKIKKHLR